MEPKSLNSIITEEEFLPAIQGACDEIFKTLNSFKDYHESKVEISRKFYSHMNQNAQVFESFLDEHGARENKTWYPFTEYIASIRNLTIACFYLRHLLERYPYYNLSESKEFDQTFFCKAREVLGFLNRSIEKLHQEAVRAGSANGLVITQERDPSENITELEQLPRLPRNIEENNIKNEEEQIVELCQKYRHVANTISEYRIEPTDDAEKLKSLVPYKLDERRARLLANLIHSVQSDYDTYVKNTRLEHEVKGLKVLRGFISVPLHLMEVVLWMCHFYERHEDAIRPGKCSENIARIVKKEELLANIVNITYQYAVQFTRKGDKLSEELLRRFVKTVRYELPVPQPLGFHARPSTYISLIVRKHEGEAHLIVDDEKYSAKSVMSLLQAGGAIADKGYQRVIFEGDRHVLDDIRILAQHNYCEEKSIPKELSYLST